MRTLRIALALLAGAAAAAAASPNPQEVSFQGKLLDSSNNPRNGPANFVFTLFDDATAGSQLWTETQNGVTVTNGVFSVRLGAVAALTPGILDQATAYLRVQVDPDAGGPLPQETLSPRTKLVAAPYAIQAMQLAGAGNVYVHAGGLVYSTFSSAGNLILPYGVQAASTDISGLMLASSATLTAVGTGVYSLLSSSGIRVSTGLVVVDGGTGVDINSPGRLFAGYIIHTAAAASAALRAGCSNTGPLENLVAIGGGCTEGANTKAVYSSFPSTESSNSTTAVGTAPADGATAAASWSCGFTAATTGNTAFVICARLAN